MDTPTKRCTKCGIEKPLTEFHRNKQNPDGHHRWCRQCRHIIEKGYYDKDPEKMRKRKREDFARNTEKRREQNKIAVRKYHEKHKKRIREMGRVWRQNNKDKVNAGTRTYRARTRHATGKHTANDVHEQYKRQKGRCYYCKCKLDKKYHVDHVIPLKRGGTNDAGNIVIACVVCNTSKNDKLPHEWKGGNGRLI